jgi:hypothetical protein
VVGRLGGVVVSVLATGPKGRGFKADSRPSFGWEVKP